MAGQAAGAAQLLSVRAQHAQKSKVIARSAALRTTRQSLRRLALMGFRRYQCLWSLGIASSARAPPRNDTPVCARFARYNNYLPTTSRCTTLTPPLTAVTKYTPLASAPVFNWLCVDVMDIVFKLLPVTSLRVKVPPVRLSLRFIITTSCAGLGYSCMVAVVAKFSMPDTTLRRVVIMLSQPKLVCRVSV